MTRNTKRNIIISIYVLIVITFFGIIIAIIIPNPTCNDGIQNQKETGVDCGGPCAACVLNPVGKDLIVTESYVIYGGEDKYDVVAQLHNPNALYGGKSVYYTVELLDSNNNVVDTKHGETFILPNEDKYIVEIGLESSVHPSKVNVSIDNVDWVQFTEFDSPQIVVKNQRFGLVKNDIAYAEAFGLVLNDSPFDFRNITVNVILKDERGVPIAVNKTEVRALDAGAKREFRLTWPEKFPGNITSSEMQAETNIFDSLNFMKKYLPDGRYQNLMEE